MRSPRRSCRFFNLMSIYLYPVHPQFGLDGRTSTLTALLLSWFNARPLLFGCPFRRCHGIALGTGVFGHYWMPGPVGQASCLQQQLRCHLKPTLLTSVSRTA